MRKLTLLLVMCMVVFAFSQSDWYPGLTMGPTGESAQFCDLDDQGRLWVSDYGAPGTAAVYVFNSDGTQADFSPITTALDENDASFDLAGQQLGGVAFHDGIVYVVSYANQKMARYNAADGTALTGWNLGFAAGDVDVAADGTVFIGYKVAAQFAVFDADGNEYKGSPLGVAGWHINRGMSVTPDGSTVYLADESDDVIAVYTGGFETADSVAYTQGDPLHTGLNNPSACEIDDNGVMWVSNTGANEVILSTLEGEVLQVIPDLNTPRGAALDTLNDLAYVVHFTGSVEMATQLVQPVMATITEIQETGDGQAGPSPLKDETVMTSGIVTAVAGNGYFLQDGAGPWTGIWVYDTENTAALGDSLTIIGTVDEYYDYTEILDVVNFNVMNQMNTVPDPVMLSTADFSTEPYEGVLIHVSEATCTDPDLGYGEWQVDDGSGAAVVDDKLFAFAADSADIYDITGVGDYSFGAYKILPRSAEDIVRVGGPVQPVEFWEISTTMGPTDESGQFCDVDDQGRLWVSDYGAPGTAAVYVFNSDGTQADFSPIATALDETGASFELAGQQLGGVAIHDGIVYVVSYANQKMARYNATDGTPLDGWALGFSAGDVDVADDGTVFVGYKVAAQFAVFDSDGNQYKGSPLGVTGWHINRGLSVTADGSTVYLADESDDVIAVYTGGFETADSVAFTKGDPLHTGLNNPSACEIDAANRMWVSNTGANEVIISDLDGNVLQTITGLTSPRGAAVDYVNRLAYVTHFTGSVEMVTQLVEGQMVSFEEIAAVKVDADEDFVPDRLGETVTVRGIISTPNFGSHSQYWLQDSTAGIQLYSGSLDFEFAFGDEIELTGEVDQYRGITEIVPSTMEDVTVLSSGNTVDPKMIDFTGFNETNEGLIVQIDSVYWVDPSEWPAEGSNGSVYFTDGVDTNYIYIDRDSDLDGWTPPQEWMNIIAVMDQYTTSEVPNDGYSLRGTYRENFIDLSPQPLELPIMEMATDGTLDLEWDFNSWAADGGSNAFVADSTMSDWGSHVVVYEDSGYTGLAYVKDALFADYTIEADIYIVGEAVPDFPLYTGIGIKMATDEGKYYRMVFRNSSSSDHGQIRLQGFDGASWHISQYWNPGVDFEPLETGWHNFKITVVDNQFWAFLNGELLPGCPYEDDEPFLTEGYPGIYKYNGGYGKVIFDNFIVTEPVIPVPEPEKLIPLWSKSIAAGTYPDYFTPNNERSMAAGVVGGVNRVYVVAKGGGPRVVVHDAWNGDSLGTLQNPADLGSAAGYFKLNCVDVSEDGIIFASNMTLAADGTNPFTVYRWDNEAATPVEVISYDHGSGRIGDMFSVYGRADDNTLVVYAAVKDGNEIIKFTTADNGMTFTPSVITLPEGALGTNPNVADFMDGTLWVKSYGKPLVHFLADGTPADTVSTELVGTSGTKIKAIKPIDADDDKVLLLYYPNVSGTTGAENAIGVDVTNGASNAVIRGYTPSIGDEQNLNGTGSVDYLALENDEVAVFVQGANNGVAAFVTSEDIVLAEMDTLFYGDTPVLHMNPFGSGYIVGTNGYGDVGKYQRMDLMSGDELQGMMFQFAAKGIVGDPDTLHMVVRSVGDNGAPADLLAAIPTTTEMIDTTMMGNTFFMDSPMMVDGPVFVGFEMIGAWDDSIALYADADGEGDNENRAWEQFSDGNFNDFQTVLNPDFSWGVDVDLWITAYYRKADMTSVGDPLAQKIPTGFELSQNYPNPFNPTTHFNVSLPGASKVKVVVYNALGQRITTLFDGNLPAGVHKLKFDGSQLASGVYFYHIEAGKFTAVKKMILVK